jgi:regulator of cell morphogenesis and NO signaling
MPQLDRSKTVAQIVLEHPECAQIFQSYKIDFCCKGGVSVRDACAGRALDPEQVFAALEQGLRSGGDPPAYEAMSTAALVRHVVDTHHAYLRKTMPWLAQLSAKVARVHGEHNPKLLELDATYRALCAALAPHLDEEERALFPALLHPGAGRGAAPEGLAAMVHEHEAVGELLQRLRAAADDYALPEWACGSYRALFAELQALEFDVLRHVHLENHVLLPRFAA